LRAYLVTEGPWDVIGHGHPRFWPTLRIVYRHWEIPRARHFDTVMKKADVFVCDNSSTIYEFAATGRPVVVLNCPRYRRDVEHGVRFWEHIPGIQCDKAEALPNAIRMALEDGPELQEIREEAVAAVYPMHDGKATDRAVDALVTQLEETKIKAYANRSPVTEFLVYEPDGKQIAAYLVEYEARTHATKIGGRYERVTHSAVFAV